MNFTGMEEFQLQNTKVFHGSRSFPTGLRRFLTPVCSATHPPFFRRPAMEYPESMPEDGILAQLDPLVAEWFAGRFASVSEPQAEGWPQVLAGRDVEIDAVEQGS